MRRENKTLLRRKRRRGRGNRVSRKFGTTMIKHVIVLQYRANMVVMHMKCKSLVIWSTFELILLAVGDKEFWNID